MRISRTWKGPTFEHGVGHAFGCILYRGCIRLQLDSTQLAGAMLLDQNDFSSKFAVVSDRENYVTSLSNAFQIFS